MGRHIGERIIQAVQIVARIGPCTARQVHGLMPPEVELCNADKYCSRAVGFGLLTVERCYPKLYRVAPVWQDILAERRKKPAVLLATPVAAPAPVQHPLDQVWNHFCSA